MVTCTCRGGPLDGLSFEEEQPPPVYARADVGEVYLLDSAAADGVVDYVHVSAELLARHPVQVGYALESSTLVELERAIAFVKLFGHGSPAPLYARADMRGRVVGIQPNPR